MTQNFDTSAPFRQKVPVSGDSAVYDGTAARAVKSKAIGD